MQSEWISLAHSSHPQKARLPTRTDEPAEQAHVVHSHGIPIGTPHFPPTTIPRHAHHGHPTPLHGCTPTGATTRAIARPAPTSKCIHICKITGQHVPAHAQSAAAAGSQSRAGGAAWGRRAVSLWGPCGPKLQLLQALRMLVACARTCVCVCVRACAP